MNYKIDNIEIDLCDQLRDFDYFTKDPFFVFEKKNFIDNLSYQKLVSEIYSYKYFQRTFLGFGDKKATSINGSNLYKLNNSVFKNFCSAVLHKNFFRWFEKTHLPFFKTKFLKLYVVKRQNIFWRVFNRLSKILRLPISIYYTEIDYTSITSDGYIPPHTDDKRKRLSFVFYLPDKSNDLSYEMKKQLGTVFWKPRNKVVSKLKRFDSTFLQNKEKKNFYENYEVFHISAFEPNKVAGFIKSDISWHSVEKFSFEYDRRAIVINVYEWF
jgi:hypothetical protein